MNTNNLRINEDKIKKGTYIICHTEETAKVLLSELGRIGFSWAGGEDSSNTFWNKVQPSENRIAYYIYATEPKLLQFFVNDLKRIEHQALYFTDVMRVFEDPKPLETVQRNSQDKKGNYMNVFGINMECGMNTDKNIASTFIGVAVKNGNSWRIYDKKKKVLTDIGDVNIGNLPLFIMPSTKLEEGDLIKSDNGYYYVVQVNEDSVKTLSAATGEMKEIIPVENILNIRFYSKVVTFVDNLLSDIGDSSDTDKLMMTMAMSSMTGDNQGTNEQMILPLLLLKDKDKEDKDRLMKFMLLSSMNGDGNNQNSMLPLLLMKSDLF